MKRKIGSRKAAVRTSAKFAAKSKVAAAAEWILARPDEARLSGSMSSQLIRPRRGDPFFAELEASVRQDLAPWLEDYSRKHADELKKGLRAHPLPDCT